MMLFNDLINHLDLVDIAFQGREYTWSNMQENPLLQKLDWVFTSSSWTLQYPDTSVIALSKPTSDHIPCVIKVGTKISKAHIFRFENFWIQMSDFISTVELHWNSTAFFRNSAKNLSKKFKQTRRGLKALSRNISKLNKSINNCS